MHFIAEIFGQAVMITGFVFVMMLLIEYLNVLTRGNWDRAISRMKWGQPVFSSVLGVMPGCLGSFAVDSLYLHRVLTFGSLVAAMIATCGDEAFVMLAMFPEKAFLIFGILFVVGIISGVVVDIISKARRTRNTEILEEYHPTHDEVAECIPFSRGHVLQQWRKCTPQRGVLTVVLGLFLVGVLTGAVGHRHLAAPPVAHEQHESHGDEHEEAMHDEIAHEEHGEWNWVRATLLLVALVGLFIVVTVPDHFLDEHLWNHIAKVHTWRIFLWTFGALLLAQLLITHVDIDTLVSTHSFPILLLACLVGFIPESGPHLIFVTLYANGSIPFSILLASCVVQDGHGMLPILAHSRSAFFTVKAINFLIGFAIGLLGLWMGW